MSRSRKKVPIFTLHHDKYFKKLVHRRNRVAFRTGEYYTTRKLYKLKVNPYDICDYAWILWSHRRFVTWTEEIIKKSLRKEDNGIGEKTFVVNEQDLAVKSSKLLQNFYRILVTEKKQKIFSVLSFQQEQVTYNFIGPPIQRRSLT